MSYLILTNGLIAVLLATLPQETCLREAERINTDFHYTKAWAFCQEEMTDEASNTDSSNTGTDRM